jgi:hypothetical protein
MIVLLGIPIKSMQHRFLSFKAQAELPPQPNIGRETGGEGTLKRVHWTPPGKGRATAAKVVVSTLV